MSVESARAFVDRLSKDKVFYDKISGIADPIARQKAVKEAGFDFSRADAEKLLPPGVSLEQLSALKPGSQELPDAMLEAVAGGKWSDQEIVNTTIGAVGAVAGIVGAAAAAAA